MAEILVSDKEKTITYNIVYILLLAFHSVPGVNACNSNPCQNNGTCQSSEGGYTCVCTPGWSGATCEDATSMDCSPFYSFNSKSYVIQKKVLLEHEQASIDMGLCASVFICLHFSSLTDKIDNLWIDIDRLMDDQYWSICRTYSQYNARFVISIIENPCMLIFAPMEQRFIMRIIENWCSSMSIE